MKKVIFLFAHPDDEFACSVRIRRHVDRGDAVYCVYLTEGGYGGQSIARREAESTKALSLLGLAPECIRFFGRTHGFRDGSLHECMGPAAEVLGSFIQTIGSVSTIYVPAWEGGHQDHDACHLIGAIAAARAGIARQLQYPLYHGAGLVGPFFRVIAPLAENGPSEYVQATAMERVGAIRLCMCFGSQWRTWLGLLPFFTMKMLFSGRFPVQTIEIRRWRQPPHEGRLLYERRGFLRYDTFAQSAAQFLAEYPGSPAIAP